MKNIRGNPFLKSVGIIIFILCLHSTVNAQSLENQLDKKQAEIEEAEQKLSQSQDKQQSLDAQLETLDGQTRLTELKIERTTLTKQKLSAEISSSSAQINDLKNNLTTLESELKHKLLITEGLPIWDLILPWEGFGKIKERYQKMQKDREEAKKLLVQLQKTREFYDGQQDNKKQQAVQSAALEQELKKHQIELADSKQAKQQLLVLTKNDEATYQRLIAQLKEELESIDRAISNLGRVIGEVKKGAVIGSVGLTGCTSGAHLHFEAYENAKVEGNKVIGSRVNPRRFLESRVLSSPLTEFPGAPVTVEFGEFYALGKHTGIDIVVPKGTPALASADGIAYAISDRGCRIPGFDHGESKGIVIDHGNGTVSLYWHLN